MANEVTVRVRADTAQAENAIASIRTTTIAAGTAMGNIFADIGRRAAGMAKEAVTAFAEVGSELHDMSARTGIGVQALSELRFAAEQSGSSLDAVAIGAKKLNTALYDFSTGGDAATATFKALGVSFDEVVGKSVEQNFDLVLGKLAEVTNKSEQSALAVKLFGKSGTDLLPLLADGAAGLDAMRQQARALGDTMSDEAAAQADALGDSFTNLHAAVEGLTLSAGRALAPALTEIATVLTNLIVAVSENETALKALGAVLAGAGVAALAAFVAAIGWVPIAIGAAAAAIGVFLAWLSDHWPEVWGALEGPVAAVGGFLSAAAGVLSSVWGAAVRAAQSVMAALGAAFESVSEFVAEHANVFRGLAVVIGVVIAGAIWPLILAIGAVVVAIKNWSTIVDVAEAVFGAVTKVVGTVIGWIHDAWPVVKEILLAPIRAIVDPIKSVFESVVGIVAKALGWIGDHVKALFDNPAINAAMRAFLGFDFGDLGDKLAGLGEKAADIFNGVVTSVKEGASAVVDVGAGIINGIQGYASGALDWIKNLTVALPTLGNKSPTDTGLDDQRAAGAATTHKLTEAEKALEDQRKELMDVLRDITSTFRDEEINAYLEGGAAKLEIVRNEHAAMGESIQAIALDLMKVFGISLPEALGKAFAHVEDAAKRAAAASEQLSKSLLDLFSSQFLGKKILPGAEEGLKKFFPGLELGPNGEAGLPGGIKLPQYATGGRVPGTGPQLAVVHGGETVVPAGAGLGSPVYITVNAGVGDPVQIGYEIAAALNRAGLASGPILNAGVVGA